jgi:diacylglycerol kinase
MKNRNFSNSLQNAFSGILYAITKEKNMKIHAAAAVVVLLMSWLLKVSLIEFMILCLTITMVIVCELINTAVEVLVDIIVDVYHPKAKIIKDVAAGAALFSAFFSVIVGLIIFGPRLYSILF